MLHIQNVYFDSVAPEHIKIKSSVTITQGTIILAHDHNLDQIGSKYRIGEVHIEKDAFIGCNSTICNSVTIDQGSIIGAGSIVTKDIPPYQVWAGNPARYIKDRAH